MPLAVIQIDRVDKQEAGYMHFYDKSQKAWNCNKPECFDFLVPGEKAFIDYNETQPKDGRKYGSKYVNRARNWKEDDGGNTWPDKEPYNPSVATQRKESKVSKDYDPEVGKKQTAANVSGPITLEIIKNVAESDKLDAFKVTFPVVADLVYGWVNATPKSNAGGAGDSASASDEDFGF